MSKFNFCWNDWSLSQTGPPKADAKKTKKLENGGPISDRLNGCIHERSHRAIRIQVDNIIPWSRSKSPSRSDSTHWVLTPKKPGYLPSPSLTWNRKWWFFKRNLLFQGAVFRFHVKLWEGNRLDCNLLKGVRWDSVPFKFWCHMGNGLVGPRKKKLDLCAAEKRSMKILRVKTWLNQIN